MKICNKCGASIKDEDVFCTECGEKVNEDVQVLKENQKEETFAKNKKNSQNKKMILIVAIVVVAIIAAVAFAVNASKTIKISDFYEIEYSGGNKFATAKIDIDHDELEYAVCEKLGYSLDSMEGWAISEVLYDDTIHTSITPNKDLKNGDVVEVKVEVANEKMIKGIKIVGFKDKVKVEGLEDYKEITDKELFDNIEVVYTGYSPFLEVQVTNVSDDKFLKTVQYTVEDSGKIKNGGTVKIKATWDDVNAENAQCYVSGVGEKEIKVEGQAEYLLNGDDLEKEVVEQIKQIVENDYKEKSKGWEEYQFRNIKELYLLDQSNTNGYVNKIYVSIEVEPSEYSRKRGYSVLYYDGYYTNVSIRDGELNLGSLNNGRFNVYDTANVYYENLEEYRAYSKNAYNLLEES